MRHCSGTAVMPRKQSMVADRLGASVDDLYRSFGAWSVAWALLRSIRRQPRITNSLSHLSDRQLVDMGLPSRPAPQRLGHPSSWNLLR
jgi:uncharacterized protein YjiS (DUF1127 family)